MRTSLLTVGDPAPWFTCRSSTSERFHFDTVAGRYVVLCFFESAAHPTTQQILESVLCNRQPFDDTFACFFGVSIDPDDERLPRVRESIPGIRFFWDSDRSVSQAYGALPQTPDGSYRRFSVVLDERLRVLAVFPIEPDPHRHSERLLSYLLSLPPLVPAARANVQAPVLVIPRVFEPELCRELIGFYDQRGGDESGFMREVDGKTVPIMDYRFKRRRDQEISDERLKRAAMARIHDRVAPEIAKAYQFNATRIERHIVACYDHATGGFFRAHRDNTTKGTAHRKFAVSLNLNTGEYDGGLLRFPEFGNYLYQPPLGGAVVFSCSLLHEATAVTSGTRYAYLPFLYDDVSAEIRRKNLEFLSSSPPLHISESARPTTG